MIIRSVLLPRLRADAFALFTKRASEWWPADRRHTRDPKSIITLTANGQFSERSSDHEVQLGKVKSGLLPTGWCSIGTRAPMPNTRPKK